MAYRRLSNYGTDDAVIEEARLELDGVSKDVVIQLYLDLQTAVAKAVLWSHSLINNGDPTGPLVSCVLDEISYEATRLPIERDVFANHIRKPS